MTRSKKSFLISIAQENGRFLRQGGYEKDGERHPFSSHVRDVQFFSQNRRVALTSWAASQLTRREARISVIPGDTSEQAGDAVLNFASATTPGGGYLYGSPAQEECLCRETSLYASLTAPGAKALYEENKKEREPLFTHSFLISPHVDIFRRFGGGTYELLPPESVKTTAVLTVPAPDLSLLPQGFPRGKVRQTVQDRMRHFLAGAFRMGYQNLTLGAWGCGAFRHDAADIAADFRRILIDEHWQSLFASITFAIYPAGDIGRYNLEMFEQTFRC